MRLNGAVLIEAIRDHAGFDETSPVLDAAFKCASPFLPENGAPDPEKLYILDPEETLAEAGRYPETYFLLIQKKEETKECPENVLCITTDLSRNEVYNAMAERQLQIGDWVEEMREAVQYGASLQELLDISEHVIGEFISVSDYAFRLLAYTKNIHTDCEISKHLIANGSHSPETIESFIRGGALEDWNKHEFYTSEDLRYTPFATAGFVYRFGNRYYNHAVMTFSSTHVKKNALWLFKMFGECIKPVVMKDWERSELFTHIYDRLVADIIKGKTESSESIRFRAEYAKMPFDGNILLFVIPVTSEGEISSGRIGNELSCLSSDAYVSALDNEIIYIEFLKGTDPDEEKRKCCSKLDSLLNNYSLRGGASSVFGDLTQLRTAYRQAVQALKIREKYGRTNCSLNPFCVKDECYRNCFGCITAFDSVFEYTICDCTPEKLEMVRITDYYKALKKLYDYDTAHHMNNLQLLRVYLENERRIGDTAECMHMHRNNIGYRLQKINELTGLDLDNKDIRSGLLLTYIILNQSDSFDVLFK